MDGFQLPELWKYSATLGCGGLLAFAMFLFYRKDTQANAAAWKGQSDALLTVVKDNTAAMAHLQTSTVSLQQSVQSLVQMIAALREEMNSREIARLREEHRS